MNFHGTFSLHKIYIYSSSICHFQFDIGIGMERRIYRTHAGENRKPGARTEVDGDDPVGANARTNQKN